MFMEDVFVEHYLTSDFHRNEQLPRRSFLSCANFRLTESGRKQHSWNSLKSVQTLRYLSIKSAFTRKDVWRNFGSRFTMLENTIISQLLTFLKFFLESSIYTQLSNFFEIGKMKGNTRIKTSKFLSWEFSDERYIKLYLNKILRLKFEAYRCMWCISDNWCIYAPLCLQSTDIRKEIPE